MTYFELKTVMLCFIASIIKKAHFTGFQHLQKYVIMVVYGLGLFFKVQINMFWTLETLLLRKNLKNSLSEYSYTKAK